jgi:predicted lipid-binding transport protein (Tim44 family)
VDIYTIIFLALAVFIFLKLRSVLGQRTGRERPPYDPYSTRDVRAAGENNVVTLPGRAAEAPPRSLPADSPPAERWKGVAESGTPIAAGLDAIVQADREFDAKHFLTGARGAYEMVVTAFAEGDKKTLKGLLSKEVYDGFEPAINGRKDRGETAETRFVSIDSADIVGAEMRGRVAHITVQFVSQLITSVRDREGTVIEGDATTVTSTTDVWTFARDSNSRDPNWKVAETGTGH